MHQSIEKEHWKGRQLKEMETHIARARVRQIGYREAGNATSELVQTAVLDRLLTEYGEARK